MFDKPIDVPMQNCCEIDVFLCSMRILEIVFFFNFRELMKLNG